VNGDLPLKAKGRLGRGSSKNLDANHLVEGTRATCIPIWSGTKEKEKKIEEETGEERRASKKGNPRVCRGSTVSRQT